MTSDAPEAMIQDISYTNTDITDNKLQNGKYSLSKNQVISFETFPHAGEYVYTVNETNNSVTGVTYSADTYKLRVYVANKDNGLYIKTITAEKNAGDSVDNSKKVAQVLFTNTYRKTSLLEIKKITTGELADKTKKFSFSINITKSATETDGTSVYSGKIGGTPVQVTAGTPKTFELADGESLKFENLPVGTRYVVTETETSVDGYTPSVQVTENGTKGQVIHGTDGTDLSSSPSSTSLVGEGANSVTFTNTYREVPITGMIINNLPFILLFVIAGGAFILLAVIKRQRRLNR